MKFNLYGADPWATIALEGLLELQREEGMLWAHAEDSGSESCYCEVARWNAATQRYERFAFCKCADYRFPELPDATDDVTAEHMAKLINELIPCKQRLPIVYRMPDWANVATPATIDHHGTPGGLLMVNLNEKQSELLEETVYIYLQILGEQNSRGNAVSGKKRQELAALERLLFPFDIEQALAQEREGLPEGTDTLVEYAKRLLAHRECPIHSPEAVDLQRAIDRIEAPAVKLETAAEAKQQQAVLTERENEREGGRSDKARPKAVRCSVCGLLVECDGDPGPVGAIRIPGNHEEIERDGFATPTELPVCRGSCQNGIVEAV